MTEYDHSVFVGEVNSGYIIHLVVKSTVLELFRDQVDFMETLKKRQVLR